MVLRATKKPVHSEGAKALLAVEGDRAVIVL
jgi:hypothetical protein